ncbi:hypothetical protein [Pontibacter populi]|uniref:Uncharacterized protein n=1 Tax=Pontibacter populi TaxID=890055 RepID=A0ABV1RSD9_9BACT
MTKLYKLALAVLLPFTAVAQQEILTVPIKSFSGKISTIKDISPAIDDAGNTCLYLTQYNLFTKFTSTYFLSLTPTGQVLGKTKLNSDFIEQQDFLGSLDQGESFHFYKYSKTDRGYKIIQHKVNKATGENTILPDLEPELLKGCKFVTSFTEGNQVYMLFYSKKESALQVLQLDANSQSNIKTIVITIDNGPSRFLRYSDVEFMNEKSAKTVYAAHHQKKLYKQGDKLYFVFDAFMLGNTKFTTTDILELDLTNSTSKLTKLPEMPYKTGLNFNSYLFKDQLFRVQVSSKELILDVYELPTLKQLKNYSYGKDDQLTLKSTPVLKRGAATIYDSDYKVLEKTSEVLRKMDKGTPAITVEETGTNTLQLTIGSYVAPTPSGGYGGGMGMPMGGGTISTPGGSVTLPSTRMAMASPGFYSQGSGVSTYFKAFLNAATYTKVEHTTGRTLQDQVDDYEIHLQKGDKRIGSTATYKANGNAYFVYEDLDEKALKLVMFSAPAQ